MGAFQIRATARKKSFKVIVKATPLLGCFIGVVGFVSFAQAAESHTLAAVDGLSLAENDAVPSPHPQAIVLGPIRHLAGLAIRENIDDFRVKMSAQNTDLRGFVAEPLQGALLRQRLEAVLRQSARDSGRFGLVMPLAEDTYAVDDLSLEQRQKLTREFGIDGFVETSLTLFPDHAAIALRIRAAADARILAHQSLVVPALPTEAQIYSGFLALWARLGQATGHLSAISWQSGDLVTVDLGRPQLQVGQKLVAGHVTAQRVHPRTGEVLSFQREPTYELVVLEVNETSSLAKVTELKLSRAKQSRESGLKGLLVWSKQEADGHPVRLRVANGQASGTANAGFDFAAANGNAANPAGVPQPGDRETLPAPQSKSSPSASGASSADESLTREASGGAENGQTDESFTQADPLVIDDGSGGDGGGAYGAGSLDRPWSEAVSDPVHWRPLPFILGVGQSWGILDTAPCANTPCNRYTGFPSSVLNLIQGTARYQVTRDAGLSFEGRFSNYPSGDVEGYEMSGRALSVHTLSHTGREQFVVYGGPDLRIGSAETVLVDRSLMALTIRGGAGYAVGTPFGKWQGRADLSFLDLLSGKFHLDANVTAGSLPMLPSELGFFLNFRDSPKDWTQVELGAQWTFRSGL